MFNIAALAAPDQKLIRKIGWDSGGHQSVRIFATLEYIPPSALQEKQQAEQVQIITSRKLSPVENIQQINEAMERFWAFCLAQQVHKIEGLTPRTLKNLIPIDPGQVEKAGGLDVAYDLDTKDQTPISDEERKQHGWSMEVKTKSDAAIRNIQQLIRAIPTFKAFVEQVVTDVSYFQDPEWEKQVKNSSGGPTE